MAVPGYWQGILKKLFDIGVSSGSPSLFEAKGTHPNGAYSGIKLSVYSPKIKEQDDGANRQGQNPINTLDDPLFPYMWYVFILNMLKAKWEKG